MGILDELAATFDLKPAQPKVDLIRRANQLDFLDVLSHFFNLHYPPTGSSWKGACPFQWQHGTPVKNFRVYPSSRSSFCFEMHGWMNATKIIALRDDVDEVEAALTLLKFYDQPTGQHYTERFADLMEASNQRSAGSPADAVSALQASLSRSNLYVDNEYTESVVDAMEVVLDRLDHVMQDYETDDGVDASVLRQWLDESHATVIASIERT